MVLLALHRITTVCFDLYGDFNTISDSITLLEPWTCCTANCLTNSIEFMFVIIPWYLATPSTLPSVTWDAPLRMLFKCVQSISCQIRSATSLLGATLSRGKLPIIFQNEIRMIEKLYCMICIDLYWFVSFACLFDFWTLKGRSLCLGQHEALKWDLYHDIRLPVQWQRQPAIFALVCSQPAATPGVRRLPPCLRLNWPEKRTTEVSHFDKDFLKIKTRYFHPAKAKVGKMKQNHFQLFELRTSSPQLQSDPATDLESSIMASPKHFQNTGEWPLPLRQTVTRTQSDTVELQNFTKAPSAFGFSCAPATHPHRLRTLHQMFPPENPTSWHRKHFAQAYTSFTFATSVNSHKFLKMEDVQCSTPSQRSQTFESILKGELRSAEFLTLRVIKIVQSSLAIFRRVPVGHIASVSVFGHTAKC